MPIPILMLWLMLAGAPDCPNPAFCSCAIRSPEISYAQAQAVFEGVVVHVGDMSGDLGQPVSLRVTRAWKNAAAETAIVHDAHPCGVYFHPGETYLVYALRAEDGRLYTTFCARTRRVADAAEDLRALEAIERAGR
jgi:hypothetical protein